MRNKFNKIALILDEKCGADKRETIMEGVETLYGSDPVSSAKWMNGFIKRLEKETDINTKEILGAYCPCQIGSETILKAKQIFDSSSSVKDFIEQMEEKRVIGKKIWYNDDENTIYITKRYACDCGEELGEDFSMVGRRCHCCLVYASEEPLSMDYCYCAAQFFYPLFAEIFGDRIVIEPLETVLTGNKECLFAIRLP